MAQIIGKGCPPLPPLSCAWGFARPGGKNDIYISYIHLLDFCYFYYDYCHYYSASTSILLFVIAFAKS